MAKASSTVRGYGTTHQRLRRRLLSQAYGQPCTRCGQVMEHGQSLDLDHTDDRTGYRGFSHSHCNRSAGAKKRNRLRQAASRFRSRW